MSSTWKIVRGIKSNRVRPGRRQRTSVRRDVIPSPQRAKREFQRSGSERELWTIISVSIRVADLVRIDEDAERRGMSRSMYLVLAALAARGI